MESLRHTFLKAINSVGQQSAYVPPALSNDFNALPEYGYCCPLVKQVME